MSKKSPPKKQTPAVKKYFHIEEAAWDDPIYTRGFFALGVKHLHPAPKPAAPEQAPGKKK